MNPQPPAPTPPPTVAALLRDRQGVRSAIVVAEILGPPVALR